MSGTPFSWGGTPGRDSIARRDEEATPSRQSEPIPAPASRPRGLGIEADGQFQLFAAIERKDVDRVFMELARMGGASRKAILLSPSRLNQFRFRTPLMAAAAVADISIFSAVLDACRLIFASSETCEVDIGDGRYTTMKEQMELQDVDGMTALMHATRSGNVAIFQGIAKCICSSQVRKLLPKTDAQGMTFLMHAASASCCSGGSGGGSNSSSGVKTAPTPFSTPARSHKLAGTSVARWNAMNAVLMSPSSHSHGSDDDCSDCPPHGEVCVEQWVPLIKAAAAFAKSKLWMPEYRALLQKKDVWQRSIIEHSVASGEVQVFEAVFTAIRDHIFDKEMDMMMETGEDMENETYEQTAIATALKASGEKVSASFHRKTKSLKRDVTLRTEASTVVSKIQSFIPGNLIVIFQLLLPEVSSTNEKPLIILIVLCAIAPLWAWGSNMVTHKDPERKNATARQTPARYLLSVPAMFFWGIGTSTIGTASLGWGDTTSAAALAVATIVIPAVDSFFAGSGARRCWGRVVITWLDICEWLGKKTSRSCKIPGCCSAAKPKTKPTTRTSNAGVSGMDSPL